MSLLNDDRALTRYRLAADGKHVEPDAPEQAVLAEALVRDGLPFRDAHERVAAAVRAGEFAPATEAAASVQARLGDVAAKVAAARARFAA